VRQGCVVNGRINSGLKPGIFNKKYIGTVLIVTLIFIFGFLYHLDYYGVKPSRAVELRGLIEVENADSDDSGSFYLVTVSQQRAAPFTLLYGLVHPHMDINPAAAVIPRGMDEDEYRNLLADNMTESRHMAQVVALRRLGYQIDIISEGVEVVGFLENAPAEPFLLEGDKLLAVDDINVVLAPEVPLIVQARQVGDTVKLELMRKGSIIVLDIPTGAHPEEKELPFLGIYIKTLPWEADIPIDIEMDTGRIGGPSAGMMFTLEIMNQLLDEDLTAGKKIAGTGTIDFEENIGRIGGVAQKVVAAENAGADYFLVPEANYEDAQKMARDIKVVAVATLDETLRFLSGLNDN
jgi:Lon-like protease